jgi:hypothetical protein
MHPFKLELASGEPADPPTFQSAVPNWKVGDTIFLGPGRPQLRVVALHAGATEDEERVLVVESTGRRSFPRAEDGAA